MTSLSDWTGTLGRTTTTAVAVRQHMAIRQISFDSSEGALLAGATSLDVSGARYDALPTSLIAEVASRYRQRIATSSWND
jgi:hypothetical protein